MIVTAGQWLLALMTAALVTATLQMKMSREDNTLIMPVIGDLLNWREWFNLMK